MFVGTLKSAAWLVYIFLKMLELALAHSTWLVHILLRMLDNALVVSVQEPIITSETQWVSNENNTIEDTDGHLKGSESSTTFNDDIVKEVRNTGMIVILNLFTLCPILHILDELLPRLEKHIIPFLEGKNFTLWSNRLIMAAGELNFAYKASDTHAYKKALQVYDSFKTILTQVEDFDPSIVWELECFLDIVMKPEELAGCLVHNGLCIYIACARELIRIRRPTGNLEHGDFVFIPFNGVKNNFIIASISMVWSNYIVSREDYIVSRVHIFPKIDYIYELMQKWFSIYHHQMEEQPLLAFRFGMDMMVHACRCEHIETVLIPLEHINTELRLSQDISIAATGELCKKLEDFGIKALIT